MNPKPQGLTPFSRPCDQLAQGKLLSAAVRSARELGYTEPHPRDDLSGLDVARKAVIRKEFLSP